MFVDLDQNGVIDAIENMHAARNRMDQTLNHFAQLVAKYQFYLAGLTADQLEEIKANRTRDIEQLHGNYNQAAAALAEIVSHHVSGDKMGAVALGH